MHFFGMCGNFAELTRCHNAMTSGSKCRQQGAQYAERRMVELEMRSAKQQSCPKTHIGKTVQTMRDGMATLCIDMMVGNLAIKNYLKVA